MDNFDLKKYLAEGKLHEENLGNISEIFSVLPPFNTDENPKLVVVIGDKEDMIKGEVEYVRKQLKTNSDFFRDYVLGILPNNNHPAIEYIKSSIKTKESEGNIVFHLSALKRWLKKEGIPFAENVIDRNRIY
jgi:hypothetical protein